MECKIAIIDDDHLMSEFIKLLTDHLGIKSKRYDNYNAAIRAVRAGNNKFDGAIIDIVLPGGKDGISLAEKFKEIDPDFKVLFCSSYDPSQTIELQSRVSKIGRVLSKPFTREDALRNIEKVFLQ